MSHDLRAAVEAKVPGGTDSVAHLDSVVGLLQLWFTPPFNLSEKDLEALSDLLRDRIKRRRQRRNVLTNCIGCLRSAGLLTAPDMPKYPPGKAPGIVCDPAEMTLAGELEQLVRVVSGLAKGSLSGLSESGLTVLTFLLMIAEGAVCSDIALATLTHVKENFRRGGQWLWTFLSPASQQAHAALFQRKALRFVVSEHARRIESGRDGDVLKNSAVNQNEDKDAIPRRVFAPLFLPQVLRSSLSVTRSHLQQRMRTWLHTSIRTLFRTDNPTLFETTWLHPDCDEATRRKLAPLAAWFTSQAAEQKKLYSQWYRVERAAKFRWYMTGMLPSHIRMLYLPTLPCQADFDMAADKAWGMRKSDMLVEHEVDAGKPPKTVEADLRELKNEMPPDTVEPVEQTVVFLGGADHIDFCMRQAHDFLDDINANDVVGCKEKIEYLRSWRLLELEKLLPETSSLHKLLAWLAHKAAAEHSVGSLKANLSSIGGAYLFNEHIPLDMSEWDADDVYAILSELLASPRAATTTQKAVGAFAAFVRFTQVTSIPFWLPDLHLVARGADIDFRRRVFAPSRAKFFEMVRYAGRNFDPKNPLNCCRAAFALLLFGGLGLRPIEGLHLRPCDILQVGDKIYIRIWRSKTIAGCRGILVNNWLSGEELDLFNELLRTLQKSSSSQNEWICRGRNGVGNNPATYNVARKNLHDFVVDYFHGPVPAGADRFSRIDLYCLRHMFATHNFISMLERGCGEAEFVHFLKALGHRSFSTFAIHYLHDGAEVRRLLLQDMQHKKRALAA